MAGKEEDREDLLAEASALIDRMELQLPVENSNDDEFVFAGYRSNGFFSIYFGQDRHYQFDKDGRLRRAYIDDRLYRAAYGKLSQLKRRRTEQQTVLERTDLSSHLALEFVSNMKHHLNVLQSHLNKRDCNVHRFVLSDQDATQVDFLRRISDSIHSIIQKQADFFSRTIKGKRLR
ncbi:MAG: hypothetical protein ABJZ55_01745 [Fuerstiella sp.]